MAEETLAAERTDHIPGDAYPKMCIGARGQVVRLDRLQQVRTKNRSSSGL
jgi:hypothetical protein